MPTSHLDYHLASLHPRLSDWTGVGTLAPASSPISHSFGSGTYTIDHQIRFETGNRFKGAGRDATVIKLPKSLYALFGKGPWQAGPSGTPGWSSGGGLLSAEGKQDVWIEDVTFEFPARTQKAHHYELGYNLAFFSGCRDSGLRRVRIVNCDSGVLRYACQHLLLDDVIFEWPGVKPNAAGYVAHYGVLFGRDTTLCLDQGLDIRGLTRHDTDVANGAHHNVVHASRFKNYVCSHHGGGPHDNLFTDINCGAGTRVFVDSGGALANMPHNGPGEVFWNLRKSDGTPISGLPPFTGTRYWRKDLAIVGHTLNRLNTDLSKEWVEGIRPVEPPNVYRAQLDQEPPPSATHQFPIGTLVTAVSKLNIRSAPALAATKLGEQPTGARGVVQESEVHDPAGSTQLGFQLYFVKVDFQSGVDGYCGIDKLARL